MRVSDLFEGYVKSNGPAFTLFGLRLHFYRDHVFYVVKGGPDLSIYRDGVVTPRNDEIYVKDAAARGVPKDIIQVISYWLNTPDIKQEALLPRIEQALEHIAGKWVSQHAQKENTMKIDDLFTEGLRPLNIQQLATISDEALDKAYGYGRSKPGNTFGWQANLKSAEFAKKMIDKGVTDIEKISDAIHQGWNVTAQAFVKNPNQFADTAQLQAAGKLEAKLQQRAKLMRINYAQLPDDEKEKDRVVARALLGAITGQQVTEGNLDNKNKKKTVMALNPSLKQKPKDKPDMRDVISGVRRGRKIAAEGIKDKELANVHPSKFGDEGEYGMEGDYVKNQLNTMIRVMTHLKHALGDNEDLPEWVEEKVSQAKGMIVSVMDYVISEKERTIEKAKGKEISMDEGKQRLDAKCWKGYRKAGTKMKGGVRVNNCVKSGK